MAATSASAASISARSTSSPAAAAELPGLATGATTPTCSAVITPSANPADTAGSNSNTRPFATSRDAAAGDSRACPRNRDCIVVNPSHSAAWVDSACRTVRVSSAATRFATRTNSATRSNTCGEGIVWRSSVTRASRDDCNSPTEHLPDSLEHMFEA